MKKAEKYLNIYPLEDVCPEITEQEAQDFVINCDYTIESDRIAKHDFPYDPKWKVNTADAAEFYIMGYNAAKKEIEKRLKPIE